MRFSSILGLSAASLAFAAPPSGGRLEQPVDSLALPKRQLDGDAPAAGAKFEGHDGETTTDGGAGDWTVFNDKKVPPMAELGDKLDETTKTGYWFVEFFSPYCGHCKNFAPTLQTFYETYYTDDPVPQTSGTEEDMNSFTRYYDFHFAKVDCVANGDACSKKSIKSFPTIKLFKNGEEVDSKIGEQTMKKMSQWVEPVLEATRPGSRPPDGPKLPKKGENHVERVPVAALPPVPTATPSPSPSTSDVTKATESAVATPNPTGKSTPLTAENFQRLVTSTHEPWFIKFYAPWCHHCQAMAPNWQGMARQMKGQLNIGEVNCEVEKRLCKDVRVKGYPALLFFQGGERIEYDGLRGLGDLINFASKAIAVREGVRDVDAAAFEELEKKEEVLFLYFYDHATTSEDLSALDRLVMSLIGHAKLVKTTDPELAKRFKISTWPRLLVSRDGKPTYYTALSPRDMRDFRRVLNWMKTVWLPIVPELTASNAREIMDGKLVVLGIISRNRPEEFISAKREIKNAALEWIDKQTQAFKLERQELRDAKQLRMEEAEDRNDQRALGRAKSIRINMDDIERKEVGFAWVDGVFWERWIRTTYGISVRDGERVVIADEDNKRYWENTMTGNPIVPSRTSILETLPRIVANPPKIAPKSTTTPLGHLWWIIRGGFLAHPLVSAGVLIGLLIGGGFWGRKYAKNVSGGFIKLSEKGSPMDGLLGGNSGTQGQGKVD